MTCQRVGSYGDLAERWTYRTGRWPLTCQTLAAHYRSLIAFHFNCWPTGGNKVSSASLGADVLLSSCSTVFQRMTMDPPASTFQQKVANHFTLRPFIQKTSSTLTASNFIGKKFSPRKLYHVTGAQETKRRAFRLCQVKKKRNFVGYQQTGEWSTYRPVEQTSQSFSWRPSHPPRLYFNAIQSTGSQCPVTSSKSPTGGT